MPSDKKKDSKALYEVMDNRRKKALGVPGWFGPSADAPKGDPANPSSVEAAPPSAPRMGRLPSEPLMQYADGRVRISLNRVSAVVVAVGLVLLVAGSFFAGRRTVKPTAVIASPVTAGATDLAEGPRLTPSSGVDARGNASPASSASGRKKGMYYLVIQAGVPTEKAAQEIIDFLHSRGVPASVIKGKSNKWMVIDDMAFAKKDGPEIEERKNKIEQLGKDYLRKTRAYEFSGPFPVLED